MEFIGALATQFILITFFSVEIGRLTTFNIALKKRVKALERENAELKQAFDELFVKRRK